MTNYFNEIQALAEKFAADVAKVARRATQGERHPAEPSDATVVKVFFDGDRDGNTFAVCLPTTETKRIKDGAGGRVSKRMWKYTYENATGTAPTQRSWGGMLKTLDGHGRTATRVEVYRTSGSEIFDLS